MSERLELVRAYIAAVERFDVADMVGCVEPDMVFIEMPNLVNVKGTHRDLAAMKEGLPKGRQILRSQSYDFIEVTEAAERLIVEARWQGIVAIPLGGLKPGDAMVAHICMMFRFRDGRIVEQKNYDCYEAFGG